MKWVWSTYLVYFVDRRLCSCCIYPGMGCSIILRQQRRCVLGLLLACLSSNAILLVGWQKVDSGAANMTCVVAGASVPCSQGNIQVCPNARVQVTCVNTASSSNLWRLPQNSCPAKNPPDAIALTQETRGVPSSCGTTSSTCGAFTAQNNGSDSQSHLCLTSVLTFNASNATSTIQCGSGDVNNSSDVASLSITWTVAPGNVVGLICLAITAILTVAWAPPTSGGSPTSYNVSINDSIGTTRSISHDGSSSYTLMFPGLTSNTLYSVTVVAINCAGSTGTTVNNYTLAVPPSAINGYCGLRGSSFYLNITWLPAMNVTTYQITVLDLDRETNSIQRREHCYIGPCYALIDLQSEVNYSRICIGSYNQRNILGLKNCTPNQDIGCLRSMEPSYHTQMNLVALLSFAVCIMVLMYF